MAIRTVRLDEEAEATLREIREVTGLPISEALKQGLRSLKQQVREASEHRPYDSYERLDLGPGIRERTVHGYAARRRCGAT